MKAKVENRIDDLLSSEFGINAEKISALEGYASENYRVDTVDRKFVLKIYERDSVNAEILVAEELLLNNLNGQLQGIYPVSCNQDVLVEKDNEYLRLLSFVEGDFLAEVEHSAALYNSFGNFLAEMNLKMQGFRNSAVEARKFGWDLKNFRLNEKYLSLIENPAERKLVEYFFLQNRERVEPVLDDLRFSVIHNDANDWNVLCKKGEVSGIIDFGDICYAPLINELAVALTYAILEKDDPIAWAIPIIRGYHETLALAEEEIELLYWLIATRLGISVCNSANAKRRNPDSKYITISEKPAWELLRKWVCLNPVFVEDEFRKACGFEPRIVDQIDADIAKRRKHTSKALSLQFDDPVKMVGAAFQYMFDSSGKTYLDCYNNIPQVGHGHPRVVEAGQHAMARLNTNTRYLNDTFNVYAENLLAKFPDNLAKVFFVNSGSAASDLAVRLAITHTQKQGIVVIEHGYHGNTRLGIDISHYKYNRKGGTGKHEAVIEAEIPDTYKGRFRNNDGTAGREYANSLIEKLKKNGLPIAAFIAEPIVGCGGQIPLAKGYLKEIYPFIRAKGGVCISDEVQTGFGRLGEYFWGFEMHEVIPDIVVLGKPMGNGHPMAAVVTTDEIAKSFETGMEFFSSFGGNPVSCAIGQAVLDVLEEERLAENASEVGGYLLGLFEDLVEKYEVCGDARGEGLFLGLELVIDKECKEPNTKLATLVQNKLKEMGIMVGTDGPFVNVIKVKPPICFTMENADELVERIDGCLNGTNI